MTHIGIRTAAVVLVVGWAVVAHQPQPAGAATLDAGGGVGVEVHGATGRISIEGTGAGRLAEAAGTTGESGRVGFYADGAWHRASELVERRGTTALLGTGDPADGEILLEARVRRDGAAELSATAPAGAERMSIGFAAAPGERYLGFGERSNAVDQRGQTIASRVSEGTYVPSDYDLVAGSVPEWALNRSDTATYFPMPWLLSTRGFGLLAENRATSRFRLGTVREDEWSVETETDSMRFVVLPGPRPADLVRQLTERTGRQPAPAAPWVLGPWFQTGHQNESPDEQEYVRILREADAPVSAAETHMRYMPCGSDQGLEAEERARTAPSTGRGWPRSPTHARRSAAPTPRPSTPPSRPARSSAGPDGARTSSTRSSAAASSRSGCSTSRTRRRARSTPASSTAPSPTATTAGWRTTASTSLRTPWRRTGCAATPLHNFYPVLYHSAAHAYRRAQERPLVSFVRSGWTGVHPSAEIVWGGDPSTAFGFDGLESSVSQALTMGCPGSRSGRPTSAGSSR